MVLYIYKKIGDPKFISGSFAFIAFTTWPTSSESTGITDMKPISNQRRKRLSACLTIEGDLQSRGNIIYVRS